jgi:alpha-tubulin suppressor-like RCC1 family protein
MRTLAILTIALVFLAGCTDQGRELLGPPTPPSFDIADGAHGGNTHFYFLPPMVHAPSFSGTFDGSLEPWVEICVWSTVANSCGATLETYTMNAGSGSERVRVDPVNELYIVNWHTGYILDDFPLGANEVYRIRVLVGMQELGHADVQVAGSMRELKSVNTDEFVPLLDGRTLPIKFRIEEGALAGGAMVSAGPYHTCGLTTAGDAYCWGYNASGQLGTGTATSQEPAPMPVTGSHTFQAVSAGESHTCGLTTAGDAYCWGDNSYGQLGTGTVTSQEPTPLPVTGGHTFQSVSVGYIHTCGLTTAGDAYCWGNNYHGQLGTGSTTPWPSEEPTPLPVTSGHTFQSVSEGYNHTCGLTTAGDAYCWGRNDVGQLGIGTATLQEPTPLPVTGGHPFQAVSAGSSHTCGVTTAGDAYCWGYNLYGQVGSGWWTWSEPAPLPVTGGHPFQAVSAGGNHTCGVTTAGDAYCWGFNGAGELGMGTATLLEPTPLPVTGSHTFRAVSAGGHHTCGLTTAGDAYCWGDNSAGQLGDNTFITKFLPVFSLDLDPGTP